MREGIGSVVLYNLVIVFIVIVFAFLAGTVAYSKAFRVNSRIDNSLEKFEGYNAQSDAEINNTLQTIGYRVNAENTQCEAITLDGEKIQPVTKLSNKYYYCLYYRAVNETTKRHYRYYVVSYLYMDLPIVGRLMKLPISSTTERIFCFHYDKSNPTCAQ